MAYEKTWQFLAPHGPRTATSAADGFGWWLWSLKAMLCGEIGTATQGLWSVVASSDGVAYGYDGVDRWGATYDPAKLVYTNGSVAHSWIILTSTIGGKQLWLLLEAKGPTSGFVGVVMYGSLPTGGTLTASPTSAVHIGGVDSAFGGQSVSYAADVVNGRSHYGAVSTTGDFWMTETITGQLSYAVVFQAPVGCKANDQWPFYFKFKATTSSYTALQGSVMFTPVNAQESQCRFYNGAAGFEHLVPPPTYVKTDVADNSLFDYPTWILVGNDASMTQIHARGRLADIGCTTSYLGLGAAGRIVNNGTTIRDGSNNIVYVTMGQLIVPYNALVS